VIEQTHEDSRIARRHVAAADRMHITALADITRGAAEYSPQRRLPSAALAVVVIGFWTNLVVCDSVSMGLAPTDRPFKGLQACRSLLLRFSSDRSWSSR
jgi:hypothetical protein